MINDILLKIELFRDGFLSPYDLVKNIEEIIERSKSKKN